MLLATVALGWWGVLFVAIAFAIIDLRPGVAAEAGLGAALAWLGLFVVNAVVGGPAVIGLISRAMSLPAVVLPVLTIMFPAMLAWSGATVARALSRLLRRSPRIDEFPPPPSDLKPRVDRA